MALKSFVLISSVNNLSDARYCAGMDVDLIGFSFEENQPNYISPEVYKELTEWLSGVDFVGEFIQSDVNQIKSKLNQYNTQFVEISDPNLAEELKAEGYSVLLKLAIDNAENVTYKADYLILENQEDHIESKHFEKIKQLGEKNKVLVGFGVNNNNVEELLAETKAQGIALKGGDEIKPGYKDYDQLADILETLEIDDLA